VLDDVEAMPDSGRTGFEGNFDVAVLVIAAVSGVVAFLDPAFRVVKENFVCDFVVGLERSVGIFFLDEINSDGESPVEVQNISQYLLIFLVFQCFQTEEDEAHGEGWMFLSDAIIHLIENLRKGTPIMFLDKIAFLIVFLELREKCSEF
jgi:hypothetical protein